MPLLCSQNSLPGNSNTNTPTSHVIDPLQKLREDWTRLLTDKEFGPRARCFDAIFGTGSNNPSAEAYTVRKIDWLLNMPNWERTFLRIPERG